MIQIVIWFSRDGRRTNANPGELRAREIPAEQQRHVGHRTVHSEYVLCKIDADDDSLVHICPLLQLAQKHRRRSTLRCCESRAASTPPQTSDRAYSSIELVGERYLVLLQRLCACSALAATMRPPCMAPNQPPEDVNADARTGPTQP